MQKRTCVWLVVLLITFVSLSDRSTRFVAHADVLESSDDCTEIALLANRLRSENDDDRRIAREAILLRSSRSESSRKCTVEKMQDIAASPTALPDRGMTLFLKSPDLFLE